MIAVEQQVTDFSLSLSHTQKQTRMISNNEVSFSKAE